MDEQIIEALPVGGPSWVELARWHPEHSDYDADGWLDAFGDRIGSGTVRLPDGSWCNLANFSAIRPVNKG